MFFRRHEMLMCDNCLGYFGGVLTYKNIVVAILCVCVRAGGQVCMRACVYVCGRASVLAGVCV